MVASNTFEEAPYAVQLQVELENPSPDVVGQLVAFLDVIFWMLATRAKAKFTTHDASFQVVGGRKHSLVYTDEHYNDVEDVVRGLKSDLLDDLEWLAEVVEASPMALRENKPASGAITDDVLAEIMRISDVAGISHGVDIVGGDLDEPGGVKASLYPKKLMKVHKIAAAARGVGLAKRVADGLRRVGEL